MPDLDEMTVDQLEAEQERLAKLAEVRRQKAEMEDAERELEKARAAYGSPAGSSGGSMTAPPTRLQEARQRVLDRLERGDGLQDGRGKQDAAQYIAMRISEAAHKVATEGSSYTSNSKTPRYGQGSHPGYEEARRRGGR
jgi:hypothetical protein